MIMRLMIVLMVLSSSVEVLAGQRFQTFGSSPGWEGINNMTPVDPVQVTQDFGYSASNHVHGGAPGEAGGRIWRTITPAFYGKTIEPLSLNDPLSASGTFRVIQAAGGSGVIFGWFNHQTMGWRPPNWIGFRLDDGNKVFVEYNSSHNQAGGDRLPGDPTRVIGNVYQWTFRYDPLGGAGRGLMEFELSGPEFSNPVQFSKSLDSGIKTSGATFTHWGMVNVQRPASSLRFYLDDVTIDGVLESFTSDPLWDGEGNRITYLDYALPGANRFGYCPDTQLAGGEGAGEIGGRLWRTEENRPDLAGSYGDNVGLLTMQDHLSASGKITMTEGAPDSAAILGWYNSSGRGWPARNVMCVVIEGPSRVGHYFRPYYGTSQSGVYRDSGSGPVILPDSQPHSWTMEYDPQGGGGNGLLTMTLDGIAKSLTLGAGHKSIGAEFNRFGLFTLELSGAQASVYLDDIQYTVNTTDLENWCLYR